MHFSSGIHYFDTTAAAQKYYAKLLTPLCEELDLTRNELDVILFLYNNPEFDRATDIVSRRGISKSHVSLSVSTLEEKGLLIRRFDENDRRAAHLELTQDGIAIAARGRELQIQYFAAMYQGISQEELQIWKNIVLKVQENIKNFDQLL